MQSSPSKYRPAMCNIGGSERRKRYRYAAVSYLAALVYTAAVLLTDVPTGLLIGLAVPLSLGTEWLLQARCAFCSQLAFSGRYSFDGEAGDVPDDSAARADRRYGFKLLLLGLLAGLVGTSVVYAVVLSLG